MAAEEPAAAAAGGGNRGVAKGGMDEAALARRPWDGIGDATCGSGPLDCTSRARVFNERTQP